MDQRRAILYKKTEIQLLYPRSVYEISVYLYGEALSAPAGTAGIGIAEIETLPV